MAGVSAFASDSLLPYPENSPHTGFHIPFETAGAVEIIAGTGGTVFQFHTERISDTDAALKGDYPGGRIVRLFSPGMAVEGKAHITRFICRHHGAENHPILRISLKQRR